MIITAIKELEEAQKNSTEEITITGDLAEKINQVYQVQETDVFLNDKDNDIMGKMSIMGAATATAFVWTVPSLTKFIESILTNGTVAAATIIAVIKEYEVVRYDKGPPVKLELIKSGKEEKNGIKNDVGL